MSIAKHVIRDHGGFGDTQSVRMAMSANVANLIGGGAGLAVVTAVAFKSPMPDTNYSVTVTPNQDATAYVSGKTVSGFNVTLMPRLAANTLAVGTFDVLVTA